MRYDGADLLIVKYRLLCRLQPVHHEARHERDVVVGHRLHVLVNPGDISVCLIDIKNTCCRRLDFDGQKNLWLLEGQYGLIWLQY